MKKRPPGAVSVMYAKSNRETRETDYLKRQKTPALRNASRGLPLLHETQGSEGSESEP